MEDPVLPGSPGESLQLSSPLSSSFEFVSEGQFDWTRMVIKFVSNYSKNTLEGEVDPWLTASFKIRI